MITRIKLSGYKSIKNLDIDLATTNILLGGNGVGKSNFVSIFSFLRNLHNGNLQNYVSAKGGVDSLLHFGRKHTEEMQLDLYFKSSQGEGNKFSVGLIPSQNKLAIDAVETAFQTADGWSPWTHESNVYESGFREMKHRQAYYVNQRLKEFEVYHFHDTSDTSPIKGLSNVNDNRQLRRDGSNLAAFLFYLMKKERKHFKRIELTIKSIAPFFDHFVLQPNRLNEQSIELEWREVGYPDTYFNAYHLSDGTLRFICLAALLMQPSPPGTIIIDEPELGLHPVAVNKLAALIRKVSSTSQIILSTQSINLIDNFDPEDVIVTERKDHSSVFRRLDKDDLSSWLRDYTLGDLWGKNKFGAQPYSL